MKRLAIVGLFCLLTQSALIAQQQAPKPAPTLQFVKPTEVPAKIPSVSGKWWKNSMVVRNLALTDAQVTQLEAVYLQHQAQLAELRSELLHQEQQLKSLLEADKVDEGAISLQIRMVGNARFALELENDDMTLGMRRLLTSVQWRKLQENWIEESKAREILPEKANSASAHSGERVYDLKSTPGITQPRMVNNPRPPYTPEARAAKLEGTLVLEATIGTDGRVSDVKILKWLGYGLDESAIETITTKWRFEPAMLNGQPVNVRANVEVTFRLY